MKIRCLYDKLVKIKEMHPHPENTNKHPEEQITRLAEILEYQGWRYPIKVSKLSGFITSGHARLSAAIKLGLKEVPVNYQEYDSEEQEYADLNADNAIALWAEIDYAAINAKLPDLGPEFNIDMLGIKDFILEPADKLEPGCDEDEIPEKVEPKTKLGDLYELGSHRLLCGDSTSVTAVELLMEGKKADMVFTDPPYNYEDTNRGSGAWGEAASKVGKSIEHISKFEPEEFLGVLPGLFKNMFCAHIFCNTALVRNYLNWANEMKLRCNILTWHKTNFIPANSNHHFPDTEYCIYIADRAIFNSGLSADHYRKYWIESRELSKDHPTVKPQAIIQKSVELNSNKNGIVVDLFGGSGSTLIACEKTKRQCFMMELDPHYCDVIVARWEKFTGKKAVLKQHDVAYAV